MSRSFKVGFGKGSRTTAQFGFRKHLIRNQVLPWRQFKDAFVDLRLCAKGTGASRDLVLIAILNLSGIEMEALLIELHRKTAPQWLLQPLFLRQRFPVEAAPKFRHTGPLRRNDGCRK